ncbi:hypothetical protein FGO68_gene4956 [Halteria grandinella]|uniref:Carbohydrate kinase PfkB domain-containing protein n=1 Tax=Halteria grandinella TaxID=5974 RepID=A0A8J8SV82_HALGN|nr:hypothetical protein FGO68_gene4956 [Halteria grandinella]
MTELDPTWADAIRNSKILLLQREIPEFVNIIAAKIAKEAGTMVILDVGGRDEPLSKELIQYIDIISPNETELERVIHKKGLETEEDIQREVDIFIRTNPHIKVLLKRGEHGSSIFYLQAGEITHLSKPAYSFADHPDLRLVDTTGAGDCFTGAFAVKMLEGSDYESALEFSNKVGFLCITKFGAGPSIPERADVERVFGK